MYDTTTTVDPATAAAVGGFILALVFGTLLFYTLPLLVGLWKLFTKAGQPGWAAIVPFYNLWVITKVGGSEPWKFWALVACIVVSFVPLLGLLTGLAALVLEILIVVSFASKYDRDAGFWVLLFLLPIVGVFFVDKANFKGGHATAAQATPANPAPPSAPPAA